MLNNSGKWLRTNTGFMMRLLLAGIFLTALIAFTHHSISWTRLLSPWKALTLAQILLATSLLFSTYWIRTVRLYYYFSGPLHQRFWLTLRLMLHHNFYNNLLPMRSGEISFPILMVQYFRIPAATAIAALLWFRLLDFSFLLLFGLMALSILNFGYTTPAGISGIVALVLIFLLALKRLYTVQQANNVSRALTVLKSTIQSRLKPRKWLSPEQVDALIMQLKQGAPTNAKHYWHLVILSAINWIVKIGVLVGIFMQLMPEPPAGHSLLAVIAAELTTVSPFHGFAGAGTFEAGVAAVMKPLGWPFTLTVTAAINLHLFILSCSVIGFVVAWLIPLPTTSGSTQS